MVPYVLGITPLSSPDNRLRIAIIDSSNEAVDAGLLCHKRQKRPSRQGTANQRGETVSGSFDERQDALLYLRAALWLKHHCAVTVRFYQATAKGDGAVFVKVLNITPEKAKRDLQQIMPPMIREAE